MFSWRQPGAWALIMLLICAALMTGCAPTAEERSTTGFGKFRSVLPPDIRKNFDNREYETVVKQIDSLLTIDSGFAARWTDLKKSEAIELFSTRDVIDYYVTYFSKDGGRR